MAVTDVNVMAELPAVGESKVELQVENDLLVIWSDTSARKYYKVRERSVRTIQEH
jgi:HSP20 family molecular chaperone IbpA